MTLRTIWPARRRRGQTLVEFATVLPFLILLIAAVADLGFYLYDFIGTHNGVRAGALAATRAYSTGTAKYSTNQVATFIKEGHGPVSPILDSEIEISTLEADPAFGGSRTSIMIAIDHTHTFIFPVCAIGGGPSIQIRSRLKTVRVPGMT